MSETEKNKALALETAISKLESIISDNKDQFFTNEEATALRDFAKLLLGLKSIGTLGGIMYRVAMWSLAFVGIWFAMKNGMADFVKEVIAGK